ncbi:MAG: hypothetical protein AAF414_06955 [Pseudomonadota bacterium]
MQNTFRCLAAALTIMVVAIAVPATGQDSGAPCLAEPTRQCILDLAIHEVGEIEQVAVQGQVLIDLINHLIQDGEIATAEATAELVEDPEFRAFLLHPAYPFGLPRTDDERENRLIDEAVAEIWAAIELQRTEAGPIIDSALELIETGAVERAMKRVEDIDLPRDRIAALTELALRQHANGDEAGAARTFGFAWQAAIQLADPVGRTEALTNVASAQVEISAAAGARRQAQSIAYLPTQVEALQAIAAAEIDAEDTENGLVTLRMAWEAAVSHDGAPYDLMLLTEQLREISFAFENTGDLPAAEVTGALSSAMAGVTLEFLSPVNTAGQQAASGGITEALLTAYSIDDRNLRTLALIAIVEAMPKA